ncbi:MAG: hypothetical protein HRT35_17570 [Algicola sp.]|nr:hypothetical protein [Algicola sp.]
MKSLKIFGLLILGFVFSLSSSMYAYSAGDYDSYSVLAETDTEFTIQLEWVSGETEVVTALKSTPQESHGSALERFCESNPRACAVNPNEDKEKFKQQF